MVRFVGSVLLLVAVVSLGGCPAPTDDEGPAAHYAPNWLDGSWWMSSPDFSVDQMLTFTDGEVTGKSIGTDDPLHINWATIAAIDGNSIAFAYNETVEHCLKGTITITMTYTGTIQRDGTITGTISMSDGTVNGNPAAVPEDTTFTLWRI